MRVVFIGTGEIGRPTLGWLANSEAHELVGVVTQPDKPVGRDQRVQAPPIKAALTATAIPVLQPGRIKHEEAVQAIRALAPDAIVVMAYGQILPRSILEIPRIASLNLHASLLPRHRGAAPIQAAIIAGDRETGITVMYMDEGLDTGDILLESRIAIHPDETGGSLHDRLAEIAPAALSEALNVLQNGAAPRVTQDSAAATYAPKLEREHGQIDWSEPAELIERKIRAFNPWPTASTVLRRPGGGEVNMKIFGAKVAREVTSPPGVLSVSNDGGLEVGANGGSLRLREVQLEGRKRMDAAELLRGHPWIASASALQDS